MSYIQSYISTILFPHYQIFIPCDGFHDEWVYDDEWVYYDDWVYDDE